jgi:hypothetical protein
MEFIVWVETRLAGKTLAVEEVAKFERCASGIVPEEIGLTLQEGKDVLKQVNEKSCKLKYRSRGQRLAIVCIVAARSSSKTSARGRLERYSGRLRLHVGAISAAPVGAAGHQYCGRLG